MAPKRLKNNISYIDVLARAKPCQRKAILHTADYDLIVCLCECALNILNGNVPLKSHDREKLEKYKTHLRELASEKTSNSKRRKILVQKGGFVPALLAPILGVAGQLLIDAIVNKK